MVKHNIPYADDTIGGSKGLSLYGNTKLPVASYCCSEALDNDVTKSRQQRQSDIDFMFEHMENCFYLSCCSRTQDYVTS
jgi:acyl-ACP thioesterase